VLGSDAAGAAEVEGAWTAGAGVAGACGHAARHAAKTYPAALARLIAACRIAFPTSLTSIESDEPCDAKVYGRSRKGREELVGIAVDHLNPEGSFTLAIPAAAC